MLLPILGDEMDTTAARDAGHCHFKRALNLPTTAAKFQCAYARLAGALFARFGFDDCHV